MLLFQYRQWFGSAFFTGNLCFWYGYASPYWLVVILLGLVWSLYRIKSDILAWLILLGFAWPLVEQLSESTIMKDIATTEQKYLLTGEISSWVDHAKESSRFLFSVTSVNGTKITSSTIRLTCYGGCQDYDLGEHWQFLVKLNPASGLANPAGFDYERWLFSNNIQARGYFLDSAYNRRLQENELVAQLRSYFKQRLQGAFFNTQTLGGMLAMLLGDRTGLEKQDKQYLRSTGTGHLIAISGLHIGLAGSFGYFLAVFFWRYVSLREHLVSKQSFAWSVAVIVALGYAIISGLGLPAQRALAMLAVFALSHLLAKSWSLGQRLNLALCVVLMLQPKAVLDVGFWLSFSVTAILVLYVKLLSSRHYIKNLLLLQLVLTTSLLALQALIFEQVALAAIFYNLWAIPLVSLILLPLSMLWLVIDSILWLFVSGLDTSHVLTWLVDAIYSTFWWGLRVLHFPQSMLSYLNLSVVAVVLMPVLVLCFRLTPHWRHRIVFLWLLVICIYPGRLAEKFKMMVLDVGQGLAVVVTSEQSTMLYDTGYGDDESSRVETVVLPYLRRANIQRLSQVIISHDDNDHAGGLQVLKSHMPIDKLIASPTAGYGDTPCFSHLHWQLGAAKIQVLSPTSKGLFDSDNNNSCVVQIEINNRKILLTGDIEYLAERQMLENFPELNADILVVPHHGSETSSSWAFIRQISPKIAINSSAYRNRFRLPSNRVKERYRQSGAIFYDTQSAGAVEIIIHEDGEIEISAYRQQNPALWSRNCYISQNYFVIQSEKDLKGC